MTTALETILSVQELDTALDQLRHRIAHLPERSRLAEIDDVLAKLAAVRADVEARHAELSRAQQRLEDEIASVADKGHQADRTLYGGTVSAPRELRALQDEIEALARRQHVLEDNALEILEQLEPVEAELREFTAQQRVLDDEAVVLLAAAATSEAELTAEVDALTQKRGEAVAAVPAALLAEYETLRARLGGIGAAPLVGNRCGGCHLTLSAVEIDRIRHLPPDAPAYCDECGRLLVRATS